MKEGQSLRFAPPPLSMTRTEFIEKFGGVYEHFPEIAGRAWDAASTCEAPKNQPCAA